MAAPAENLLSPGYRTGTKENTFTKQREQCVKRRAMQLQQRLQELEDRECQAQRHNKQLLQQFEKAQDALKEMLARNAAMKTIRMEYERYLEENSPRWQQQLQEKTQAAQKKRMGDCLRSYLEKTDEKEVLTSTVDGPLLSQGPQKCVAPQEKSDYNQNSSSHHPFSQSSWLTSTQTHTGRFPGFLTAPHQSHSPFLFPLPSPLHPHSFLLQHLTSSPGQCQPWSGQDAAGWDSSQHNDPRLWTAAIPSGSLGQLHTALRGSQAVGEEDETSRSPNSNRKDGGSGSCLSPDLDVKPVRLFSSESGRDSSLACTEKRKKRGRTQHPSSDSERSDSQKSSRTSTKIVASFTPAQNSDRSSSSEESSTRRSRKAKRGGGTSQPEEGAKEETCRKEGKESQNTDEKEENQSHGDKSKSCGAEEQGKNLKTQSRAEEETDFQEGSSSEQSCIEDKDEEDVLETGDEEENSQKSEKQISDLEEDDDVSTRKKTSEEDEEETEDQGDEEQLNNLKSKDTEIKEEDSASSQDEDEDGSEGSEDKTNEEEEGSNKEEDSSEEEESGDSEDIIISPHEKRSKQMLAIPEEAAEEEDDDDESKTQSSNEASSDEDDIENLLAPLEQTKKEQRDVKADGEPKAVCQNMNMVQVTEVKSKTNHQSDSDEFDDFYD